MKGFFNLVTSSRLQALLADLEPVAAETLPIDEVIGRVVARDVFAGEDLPPFSRSTMDGFAVRARDSFGASESEPALFSVSGEVRMGEDGTGVCVRPGQAVRIWTGGQLPAGADAVVMLEYAREIGQDMIEVFRAVAPSENIIERGQDYRKGEMVFPKGTRLRAQELGVLAGLGILEVEVRKQPLAVVISTGDELVPREESPPPGKIRDINTTTISALCRADGCRVFRMGIIPDSYEDMLDACRKALEMEADLVLVSGGSSVGNRDFTMKVFRDLEGSELLVHGVSIRPGKPTLVAKRGNAVLFGLPGHVGSAMVVYWLFVRHAISVLLGADPEKGVIKAPAICSEHFPSVIGREDYVRVALERSYTEEGKPVLMARPVHGKSGLISTLVRADGLLVIPRDVEGYHGGEYGEVIIFP